MHGRAVTIGAALGSLRASAAAAPPALQGDWTLRSGATPELTRRCFACWPALRRSRPASAALRDTRHSRWAAMRCCSGTNATLAAARSARRSVSSPDEQPADLRGGLAEPDY